MGIPDRVQAHLSVATRRVHPPCFNGSTGGSGTPGPPLAGPQAPVQGSRGPGNTPVRAHRTRHLPTTTAQLPCRLHTPLPPLPIHLTSFIVVQTQLPSSHSLSISHAHCSAVTVAVQSTPPHPPSALSSPSSASSVQRPASFSSTAATTCSDADTQPGKQAHKNTQAPLRVPLQRPSDKAKPGLTHAE